MIHWAQLTIGFLFTMLVGFLVKPFLKCLRANMKVPDISDNRDLQESWLKLQVHPDVSGTAIGVFERIIFFWALYVASWEAVGIWLVFKVASKWEAWNHMGYVPDDPDREKTVPPLRWAYARRVWAAQGYATFVVGTAANLLLAAVGVFIAKYGFAIANCLGSRQP
jgi:hypothetical protein